MKKINIKCIISSVVFTTSALIAGMSYAAVMGNTSAKDTHNTTANTAQTTQQLSQSKLIQDFKSDNLNIQFRYSNGKIVGVRLQNSGSDNMMVTTMNTHYVLGPNDYVVFNPPNTSSLHIYHAPYFDPLTVVDAVFPQRFGKHEVYIIPKNISDDIVATSTTHGNVPKQ